MTIIIRKKGYGTCLKDVFQTVIFGTKRYRKTSISDVPVLPWAMCLETGFNNVINKHKPTALLSDKPRFRKLLEPSEVRVPRTFYTAADASKHLIEEYPLQKNHLPLIGRPRYHFAARNFKVCFNEDEVRESVADGCVYWQVLLPKDREFRVFVAFGRVWCVMEKLVDNKEQPAWNHSQGAHFVLVKRSDWLSKLCWMALEAQRLSGIDIAAMDIILSDGKFYFLEGNTAASITGEYKQNLLKKILEWVDRVYAETGKLPEHYPIPNKDVRGWKNYILEAVCQ